MGFGSWEWGVGIEEEEKKPHLSHRVFGFLGKRQVNKKDLEQRTKKFAVSVIGYVESMPKSRVADVVGRQLMRAGTSIGANYREANRAESRADFHHKIALSEKEASETLYWLELCQEAGVGDTEECASLLEECDQLLAIFTAVGKSTKPEESSRVRDAEPEFLS